MQTSKPFLTQHRRQRLVLWALALLAWIADIWLAGRNTSVRHERRRTHHGALHHLRQTIARLVLLRAHDFARARSRASSFPHAGRKLRPAHLKRSYIGGKLRRALKRQNMRDQIAVLLDALTHLDIWAKRYIARIKNGLTRLWPRRTSRTRAQAIRIAFAPPPAFADSS